MFTNRSTKLSLISKLVFILMCLIMTPGYSLVEIKTFKKKHSWNNSWNESISKALDEARNSIMMQEALDEMDLKELGCTGFNQTKDSLDRKKFWIVFFSGLTRAESAFNPRAKSVAPKGGHGNYGLLQFSKSTARKQCGLDSMDALYDPNKHLKCAVKLMSYQLKGAPNPNGKLLRPDLRNQLFGKYILLWGPLRQNDKKGRSLLVNWFKDHLEQLPFCNV